MSIFQSIFTWNRVVYKRKLLSQYTQSGRQIILKLVSTVKWIRSACNVFCIMLVVCDLAALMDDLNWNFELCNLLLPACKKELIFYEAPDKVAFVLNLKNPDSDDYECLELTCQKVSECNLGQVVEIPGSFFMYEQDLKFAASIYQARYPQPQ